MDENNTKIIKETFDSMPQGLKDFIMSDSYEETLNAIGAKYQLNAEQINALQQETTIVVMGLIDFEDFESELAKELNIDAKKISEIVKEVNEKIFSKITPSSNIVQDLDARFDKMPENIQEVVEKSNYQALLYEISTAHKLSVPQMGTLDTITTDLIVGSIHPDEFKKIVIKKIGLPEAESAVLVNEINEKVFKKIRGQLMALTGGGVKSPEPEIQTPKEDLDTLKSHGIEIAEKQPVPQVEKLEIPAPKTEIHPLLTQKMSAPVQSTSVKNEYELKSTPVQPPKINSYPTKADPYREIPE